MPKTAFRENRMSNGTKAKVARIVADLRANPPGRNLEGAPGIVIFAVWKDQKKQRR